MRPSPVWTSSQTNSAPARGNDFCAVREIAVRRHVDALALDRLDDQRRDVASRQLALERVEHRRTGRGRSPGSSGPKPTRNSSLPFTDSEPSVSPWNAWSA